MNRSVRGVTGICIIASTLSLAAATQAQQRGDSPQPPSQPPGADARTAPAGAIRGGVTLEVAPTTPLEARITAPDGSERVVPVDASGQFHVPDLPPGAYAVQVVDNDREAAGTVEVTAGSETQLALAWSPAAVAAEPDSVVASDASGDMVVTVDRISAAQQLQQSAAAVQVVDMGKARAQSADLGEVMARSQGIGVRREGGLGSVTRFSLNGLSGDQVRFFLDDVPLELSGYPFGVASVPVNLVERVEVFRGVVPVRFGADALGGAVNLVSPEVRESYLSGSYQLGSFGTHRVTVDGRYLHEPSGITLGAAAFTDLANNDYEVDVDVANARGVLESRRLRRFHDAYRAYGGRIEAAVQDKPWAKRLLLTAFASTYDKEVQNDVTMSIPYGEVTLGETVYGATARYDVALTSDVEIGLTASYSHRVIDFVDDSRWHYNWFGQRFRDRLARPNGERGEISTEPSSSTLWQDAVFSRALLTWDVAAAHLVRLSLAPAFTTRTGEERLGEPTKRDRLSGRSKLLTFVAGLEYELNLFDDLLSNVLFAKDYVYHANILQVRAPDRQVPDATSDQHTTTSNSLGFGDSLRVRLTDWLYAKASYEYATRMPRPDEVFGNGALIRENLELKPEVSHNANFGPHFELKETPVGDLTLDINAFLRDSDRLIVLLADSGNTASYQNIFRSRGLGLENAISWASPGQWVSVDGTLTWQDIRNHSTSGPFSSFEGKRIPNLPYLLGSWGARVRLPGMPGRRDTLEPFYYGRYVHEFFRFWEGGIRASKDTIDTQVSHDVGISWLAHKDAASLTTTFEVANVSDAKLYDNFGVQRPGRAYYMKLTARLP